MAAKRYWFICYTKMIDRREVSLTNRLLKDEHPVLWWKRELQKGPGHGVNLSFYREISKETYDAVMGLG